MTYLDGDDSKVGARVKAERTLRGLTITDLSKLTKISVVTLSRIENGLVHARLCSLNKIADALNIKLEKLIK